MNYKKLYDKLMEFRLNNPPQNVYTETHHITPVCMGGSDGQDNLVRLTAREHYLAHAFLFKHYKTSKLAHAWFSMLRCDKNQKRYYTARQYEMARNAHSNALKDSMKGEGNHFYGKTHSKETREILSEKNKEWHKHNTKSEAVIDNWVDKVARKPASEKQKQAASTAGKNKITLKNINTGECVKVDRSLKSDYDSNIWKNPAAIHQKREKCIHCEVESTAGNIKRWHNDNCKTKLG